MRKHWFILVIGGINHYTMFEETLAVRATTFEQAEMLAKQHPKWSAGYHTVCNTIHCGGRRPTQQITAKGVTQTVPVPLLAEWRGM